MGLSIMRELAGEIGGKCTIGAVRAKARGGSAGAGNRRFLAGNIAMKKD